MEQYDLRKILMEETCHMQMEVTDYKWIYLRDKLWIRRIIVKLYI